MPAIYEHQYCNASQHLARPESAPYSMVKYEEKMVCSGEGTMQQNSCHVDIAGVSSCFNLFG
jgi:hypothetical protein